MTCQTDLTSALDNNGLDYALWQLRALPEEHEMAVRLLICDLIAPALKLANDKAALDALDAVILYVSGESTKEGLKTARDNLWDISVSESSDPAWASNERAWNASISSFATPKWRDAWELANGAARDSARMSAMIAARDIVRFDVSDAARSASWAAAWTAAKNSSGEETWRCSMNRAGNDAMDKQEIVFRQWLESW